MHPVAPLLLPSTNIALSCSCSTNHVYVPSIMSPSRQSSAKKMKKQQPNNKNSNDTVLIVLEENGESMDVTLAAQVFTELGMTVVHAARQTSKAIPLTKNVSIKAQLSFKAALRQQWKVLVLPGGYRAVERLMVNTTFLALLETQVANGLVAAMGAFGVYGLPSLKYLDPLGPTCFPSTNLDGGAKKTTTVVTYNDENIWTAPGLGTATELALTVGEHLYGYRQARRAATLVGFRVGEEWHMEHLVHGSGPWHHQLQGASSPRNRKIDSAFWESVWPKLAGLDWYCDFEEKRRGWNFMRPGQTRKGRKDMDWFDSSLAILDYLDDYDELLYTEIMAQIKGGRQYNDEGQNDASQQNLFLHVVWKRLKAMGWRRLPSSTPGNDALYATPTNHSSQAVFVSPKAVLKYLLNDKDLRMQAEILYIVDLYRQCEQTRIKNQSVAVGKKLATPVAIEDETKRQVPALCIF